MARWQGFPCFRDQPKKMLALVGSDRRPNVEGLVQRTILIKRIVPEVLAATNRQQRSILGVVMLRLQLALCRVFWGGRTSAEGPDPQYRVRAGKGASGHGVLRYVFHGGSIASREVEVN